MDKYVVLLLEILALVVRAGEKDGDEFEWRRVKDDDECGTSKTTMKVKEFTNFLGRYFMVGML
jgi:hypothetical protein